MLCQTILGVRAEARKDLYMIHVLVVVVFSMDPRIQSFYLS